MQLGLSALRGFVTEFQYESVYFAAVDPAFCAGRNRGNVERRRGNGGRGERGMGAGANEVGRAESDYGDLCDRVSGGGGTDGRAVQKPGEGEVGARDGVKGRKVLPVQNVEMIKIPQGPLVPTKDDPHGTMSSGGWNGG